MTADAAHRLLFAAVAACALSAAAPAQVVINEVNVGSTDWLELINFGASPQSVGGWQVLVSGDNAPSSPVTASFTIPGGTVLAPEEILVITEDSSLSIPPVPVGVTKLFFGGNVFWHGSAVGQGGVCTLTDGALGIDTVNWLAPANTDPVPPATFPVTIGSLAGDAIFRATLAVPGSVVDWTSASSGTPGERNPGQEPPPGLDIVVSHTPSTFTIDVCTTPPVPFGEVYNLFSSETWIPAGSGPLFGIGLDAFEQIFVPIAFNLPFHALLDQNGAYTFTFGFPVPPGLHVESVSLLIESMALSRLSHVHVLDT